MRLSPTCLVALATVLFPACAVTQEAPHQRRNVIIFVADGLRRGSVNAEDMPTFLRVRTEGVDFRNSHSVFPTFTTANASVIATGHGLGDTGDFSNSLYTGSWLAKPEAIPGNGTLIPFIEDDELLADLNYNYKGNYLGEKTLLSEARSAGFNVASVGKLGPTAIQQIDSLGWQDSNQPTIYLSSGDAIIVDDSTGQPKGLQWSNAMQEALQKAHLPLDAPARNNGFGDTSRWNNGFHGDAQVPGTLDANRVQEQWFADVTTKVLLPQFAADSKPFVLLFWSRDPDGTQHNEGDSLQNLKPGINGDTSKRGLQNADHCLKELLDWLDAHPAIKANTDVLITSDHGFATISRREISRDAQTGEPSAQLTYEPNGKDKPEPPGTLPSGFLAIDLGIREHLRVFDPNARSVTGSAPYQEVTRDGLTAQYPSNGSALLGENIMRLDGSDARMIVAANGGSDLIYVPSHDPKIIHETVAILAGLDYVGGIFVDDKYCPAASDCPGALPLKDIGLVGHSEMPRPAIVVNYKVFYQTPGDLQSAAQIADSTLQEGQGQHGGFGRDQTFNNMAAIGPDFKKGFADESPMGNIDIVPTLAHILGIDIPSVGTLKGRVLLESLTGGKPLVVKPVKTTVSAATSDGSRTVLEYQEQDGVRYYDRACLLTKDIAHCE